LDTRDEFVGHVLGEDRGVAGDDCGGAAAKADDLDLEHAAQPSTTSARRTVLRAFCVSAGAVL